MKCVLGGLGTASTLPVSLEKALKFRQNFKAFSRLFQGSPKNPLKTLWKPKALKPTGLFQGFFQGFFKASRTPFSHQPHVPRPWRLAIK